MPGMLLSLRKTIIFTYHRITIMNTVLSPQEVAPVVMLPRQKIESIKVYMRNAGETVTGASIQRQ